MLDIKRLKEEIEHHEGKKNFVYKDHLGKPTFGIGHLLKKSDIEYLSYINLEGEGLLMISEQRIQQIFDEDIKIAIKDCQIIFDNFDNHDQEVKLILINMAFNLGRNRLAGFKRLTVAINSNNYKKAAVEMEDSDWARIDVPKRAMGLIERMDKFANWYLCNINKL